MTKFDAADLEQMKKIENDISRTVAKYRGQAETMLVVFACCRVARALMEQYPAKVINEMREAVIVPFLRGAKVMGRLIH